MMRKQGSLRGLAICAVLSGGMLASQAAGQELRFSLDQRFEASDNLLLRSPAQGSSLSSSTRLSFGYSAETVASAFRADASGVLRAATGPAKGEGTLQDPTLRLSYKRSAAAGEFDVSARVVSNEIAFLRPFEDFIDPETGEFIPPDDLGELTGSGRRIGYGADVRLRLGDQSRIGTTLRAGIRGTRYRNVTNPALVDNRRATAGIGLRFTLSSVTEATFDMGWSRFSSDAPLRPDADTFTLAAGLSSERPNGRVTARITAEKRDGARTRYGLGVGQSLDLPLGTLSYGVGVTWGDATGQRLNGNIAWTRALPSGQIRLSLNHGLTSDSNDATRQITSGTFGWQHQLTELSGLSLDMGLYDSRNLQTGTSVRNVTLGLGYNHQMTEDWALSTGYRYRMRDSVAGRARSNTVFVSLRRDFMTGF